MTFPICVLCKVKLDNIEQYRFKCPKCKNDYFLYNEIIEYENDVGTAYDDIASTVETAGLDSGGAGIEVLHDEEIPTLDDIMESEHNPGRIPIPWYMKGPNVEYEEELPAEE